MKLRTVEIDAFRSIKEKTTLYIDPAITILIGANDAGKSNLLQAIRSLNREVNLTESDENWDKPKTHDMNVKLDFALSSEQKAELGNMILQHESQVVVSGEQQPEHSDEPTSLDIPDIASFGRIGPDDPIEPYLLFDTVEKGLWNKLTAKLMTWIPRVELFEPVRQEMDAVELANLENDTHEFMQGLFRYAGIWDARNGLFTQDPKSSRQLETASQIFTERIRDEWKQGENLTFKFQHAGTNGGRIEFLISDPSVSSRFIRPSERSQGFSAFFALNMRMLARTEASSNESFILLFDEPGTALHPAGQVNLQRVFERLAQQNQIIYTTHSLFMISNNRPERSRVISRDERGTRIDRKPFSKNWRAVKKSLGLLMAGNFFIADSTLLVEGESDAIYIGALLSAFDRLGKIDVDLNLFSVKWAGISRDMEPMARLMAEEGRTVVVLVDGDAAGGNLKRSLVHLQSRIADKKIAAYRNIEILEHDRAESIEDFLPNKTAYAAAVLAAAKNLVSDGYRTFAPTFSIDQYDVSALFNKKEGTTLGKHVENETRSWFHPVKEPISKVTIAQHYVQNIQERGLSSDTLLPPLLGEIVSSLALPNKASATQILASDVDDKSDGS